MFAVIERRVEAVESPAALCDVSESIDIAVEDE